MSLLIDGYNLLNATGIMGRGVGPGSLHRSRLALLNFLAESLDPGEIARTTVVFDAHDSPPGLPRKVNHRGITVHFSSKYPDADTQIEELIRQESSPRRLTVVSSDHRLQRAAKRRKAKAVDADVWYAEVVRRREQRRRSIPEAAIRPPVPLLEEDVNYWIRQFGGESALMAVIESELDENPDDETRPVQGRPSPKSEKNQPVADDEKVTPEKIVDIDSPFPPGYAEDLLEGNDADDLFPPGYAEDVEDL